MLRPADEVTETDMPSESKRKLPSRDKREEIALEAGLLPRLAELGFEQTKPWLHTQETERTIRYVTTHFMRPEYRDGTYILSTSVAVKELIRICAALGLPPCEHADGERLVTHATARYLDYFKSKVRTRQIEDHSRRSAVYRFMQIVRMRRPPTWVDLEGKVDGYRRMKYIEKVLERSQLAYRSLGKQENEQYKKFIKEWGKLYADIWLRYDQGWFAECEDAGFVADWMTRDKTSDPAFHNDPYHGAMYCLAGYFDQGRRYLQGAVNLGSRSEDEIYNKCMADQHNRKRGDPKKSEEYCKQFAKIFREGNQPGLQAAIAFAKWFNVELDL